MKKLNLENCTKLSRGEVALSLDVGATVDDLNTVLSHCCPNDDDNVTFISGQTYIVGITDDFWYFVSSTKLQKIPLSDFFIEESTQIPYNVMGVFIPENDYSRLLEIEKKYNEILNLIQITIKK